MALAAASPAAPARAEFVTGRWLLERCERPGSGAAAELERYNCLGFIIGAVDSMMFVQELNRLPRCIPQGLNTSRIQEVAVAYMRANPRDLDGPAAGLVVLAMVERFNCRIPVPGAP